MGRGKVVGKSLHHITAVLKGHSAPTAKPQDAGQEHPSRPVYSRIGSRYEATRL